MKKTKQELQAENDELRSRLEEAEETLNAIRSGEVDALIVGGKDGQQIYTLTGADRTYRLLLESMSEGAVTLNPAGIIIYCNSFFAGLLKTPLDQLTGAQLLDFVPLSERQRFASLLAQCGRGEITLQAADNDFVPVYLSVNMLPSEPEQQLACLIVTDLTEQKRDEKIMADGKLSKLILQQAAEAVIVCDKSGNIILASNTAHDLCGQNPLYQPFDKLFPLTLARGKFFTIAQTLRRQAAQSREAGFLRKDGTPFDLLLTSGRLVDENRKILGCIITLSDITERKHAEKALRESEHRFRSLAEEMPHFVWEADGVGLPLYANKRFYDYTGLSPEQALAGGWLAIQHPEDIPRVEAAWQQALAASSLYDIESRFRERATGAYRWFKIKGSPVRDAAGRIFRWVGTCTDIHEQKQSEGALKKSERLYRAIGESIDYGVWMCEPDGRNIYASDSFLKLVGLTQEQCSNFGWGDVLHPDVAERTIARWKECVRTGREWNIQHRFKGVDGQWHPVLARGVPVRDEQGNVECWAGINLDISTIKIAEEALRQSEERLRLAQEAARIGVFEWNIQTGVNVWTTELEAMHGLAPGEFGLTQPAWEQLVHPEDHAATIALNEQTMETGNPVEGEWRVVWRDGSVHWISGRFQCFKDAAGKPLRLTGVNIDITARKQAEEALEVMSRMLSNAQEIVHLGSFEYITATRTTVWSKEEFRIYGLDPAGPSPSYDIMLATCIHPDDAELLHTTFTTAMQSGSAYELEHRIVRPDGSMRYVYDWAQPYFNGEGELVRYVGATLDITDRKQLEMEQTRLLNNIHEEKDRLQALVNSIKDEIWFADTRNKFTLVNPAAVGAFGLNFDASAIDVQKFAESLEVHRPDGTPRPVEEAPALRALGGEVVQDQEEIIRIPASGELRHRQVNSNPVRDASGQIIGSVSVVRDITELKAIEKAQLFLLQCGQKEEEDFFESLARYLAENLKMDFVCIDKLLGDRLSAQTLAMYCDGHFEDNIEYTLQDTPCGDVVGNQVCSFARDVRRLFPNDAALQDLRAESYVGTTLWSMQGKPIGLIAVIGRKPLADTSFVETILKLVGIRAAGELENRAASEVLHKANKAYQALSESGQAVITARSETELMHEAVRIVQEVCDYSLAWIGLAEQNAGKTIRIAAQAGDINGYLNTVRITWGDDELGRGPTGTAIRTRQPVINHNTLTTPSLAPWRDRQKEHGFLSSAAFPICTDEEVLGALTVYAPTLYAFTKDETRLLMELSSNLAYGILFMRMDNSRKQIADNLRTSNARLDILAETASQLLKTDSPQQTIESLCRRVMAFLDCQAFFNFLVDEDRDQLHLNACAGIPQEEKVKIEWLDYGVAVCGCAARDGCRIVAEDILHTPDIRTELVKSYGIQAYACHPLLLQGEVIGTLSFGTSTRPHFTDDELALMKAVADQVSIAIKRKQAQSRISQLNLDLEHKLEKIEDEVRRRKLAEEILLKYAEDLATSNEELDSFAAAVSHDLQEPLRSIAGFMRLIDKKYGNLLDSNGREYIERSMASSKRLGDMINSLLSYSRITTRGKEFEHHGLDAVLQTALENLNSSISQTRALITSEPLPSVYGDPDQLVRVFQNLIGNSIKYCVSRRPAIHISWQRMGDACIIAVKDNGEGIEPEYLGNVFDIFTRVPSQQNIAGTGMGLAVCKKIISRHKGQLWAESEPGKGSTFFFSLPVR